MTDPFVRPNPLWFFRTFRFYYFAQNPASLRALDALTRVDLQPNCATWPARKAQTQRPAEQRYLALFEREALDIKLLIGAINEFPDQPPPERREL